MADSKSLCILLQHNNTKITIKSLNQILPQVPTSNISSPPAPHVRTSMAATAPSFRDREGPTSNTPIGCNELSHIRTALSLPPLTNRTTLSAINFILVLF